MSLRQPHVRWIMRGKAGRPYEFGQKMHLSVVNGFTFIEEQSYDNFNEGTRLKEAAERYRERFGQYPKAILADTIYRNRENRKFCKEHGIHLSMPRLGRPRKDELEEDKAQRRTGTALNEARWRAVTGTPSAATGWTGSWPT